VRVANNNTIEDKEMLHKDVELKSLEDLDRLFKKQSDFLNDTGGLFWSFDFDDNKLKRARVSDIGVLFNGRYIIEFIDR
jgi:hypothetical protein